ncbi:MAG: Rrf2 family transcriptional regulator [Candidatus Zixiibacteriota bacterium]|nr:MAG: Rrf2 family transcriptional regulator [candidate division Zixibacteria bacterium]
MKIYTRARYGLRMMVELARELRKTDLVHLGKIARITGLSENYLAQLAMVLKSSGLVRGVSGKKGGYQLAKPPDRIKIREVVESVIGPINLTECVNHPEICLNSCFCEARMIWVMANARVQEVLDEYTLADLVEKEWIARLRAKYPEMHLLNPDVIMSEGSEEIRPGCPQARG